MVYLAQTEMCQVDFTLAPSAHRASPISLMFVLHALPLHLLQLKHTSGHTSMDDVLRQPQTTMAETLHSYTIRHGPLSTRQTMKSVSSTYMLRTKKGAFRRHKCYRQKAANSTCVHERSSFSLVNYAEMRICFIESEI